MRNVFTSVLLFVLIFSFSGNSFGQEEDDPRFDRIPQWYYDTIANRTPRESTVVTIDGYDNYFLGTDFAEGHISENPRQPGEYFAVFNTDGAHYTINGHDWDESNPNWGGVQIRGDVLTAYDSLGNLYYENMYGSPGIQGCRVVVSQDNGQTWGPAVTAISGVDKNWMCADQTSGPYATYVYTVMTSNSGGNFARSTDQGQTFQNTATFSTQSLPGMMCAVGPNGGIQGGSVYVVTNGGSTTAATYTFYQSTNGGQNFTQKSAQNWSGYVGTFTGGRHSVNNMRTRPYPFIAADNSYGPNRGRLYCVYAKNDPPGSGNKPDIWCRHSDDAGATWSGAVRVNNDLFPQANHQFNPAIWCDKETGRLYIQWMDTREDPSSNYAYIYATYSDDGGESFAPNQRVSNEEMIINCTSCGGGGSPRYQGDYNGIISNENVAMATWADFRDGSFDSYTAYFPDYAMTVSPEVLSLSVSDTLYANVPGTKLYDDVVVFSTAIETPPSGTITYSYPEGFSLNSFPGSIPIVITVDGDVPLGSYDVTITGKGPNGTPVHKRFATIEVVPLDPPVADFYADTTEICAGDMVNFFDQTTNAPSSWEWQFAGGEPATSTNQNPEGIVYNEPGKYEVTLIVDNGTGSDTITKTDYIEVFPVPSSPEGEDQEACENSSIPDLEVSGENVSWFDDPELTNLVFEGNVFATGQTEPGEYTYYVISTQGFCISDPDSITLVIYSSPEVMLDAFAPLCEDAEAFELTGGMPEGGEYFGEGVLEGMFDPELSGIGTHIIGYAFINEFGCSDTAYSEVTVNALPDVSFNAISDICEDAEPFNLTGGLPEGGEYSGPGVTDNVFDPAAAGVGVHEIMYEYFDENGCYGAASGNIEVLPLPGKAAAASGPVSVDTYEFATSEFTTTGADNADGYSWVITPMGAGTTSSTGTTAEIQWNTDFTGEVTIEVYALNGCGNGETSDPFTLQVYSTLGVNELGLDNKLLILPNPNEGSFNINYEAASSGPARLTIMTMNGERVLDRELSFRKGENTYRVNLHDQPAGIYLVSLEDGTKRVFNKIIIR